MAEPFPHIAQRPKAWPPGARAWRPLGQVLFIGIPLAAALAGWLGGTTPAKLVAETREVRFAVTMEETLRGGKIYETLVEVTPARDLADLTIWVDAPLWRRMNVDTLLPDADSVESTGDRFAFHFGPIGAGETFLLKIDGQLHPEWMRQVEGRIGVGEGDRPLASVPLALLVLP